MFVTVRRLMRIEVRRRARVRNCDQAADVRLAARRSGEARLVVAGRVVPGADVDVAEAEERAAAGDRDRLVRVDLEVGVREADGREAPRRRVGLEVPDDDRERSDADVLRRVQVQIRADVHRAVQVTCEARAHAGAVDRAARLEVDLVAREELNAGVDPDRGEVRVRLVDGEDLDVVADVRRRARVDGRRARRRRQAHAAAARRVDAVLRLLDATAADRVDVDLGRDLDVADRVDRQVARKRRRCSGADVRGGERAGRAEDGGVRRVGVGEVIGLVAGGDRGVAGVQRVPARADRRRRRAAVVRLGLGAVAGHDAAAAGRAGGDGEGDPARADGERAVAAGARVRAAAEGRRRRHTTRRVRDRDADADEADANAGGVGLRLRVRLRDDGDIAVRQERVVPDRRRDGAAHVGDRKQPRRRAEARRRRRPRSRRRSSDATRPAGSARP